MEFPCSFTMFLFKSERGGPQEDTESHGFASLQKPWLQSFEKLIFGKGVKKTQLSIEPSSLAFHFWNCMVALFWQVLDQLCRGSYLGL